MQYHILITSILALSVFDIFIFKTKKNKIVLAVFSIIIYSYFLGRRGFVASDWIHYFPTFISSLNLEEALYFKRLNFIAEYEIGYKVLLTFFKSLTTNYDIYIFLTTFLDISFLVIIFFYYSPYPIFSIFIFLIFSGLNLQLDLMRNIKAMIIFLYSLKYLTNKEYFKVYFFNIIAFTIHRTSFLYIILISFLQKKIYKKKYLILILFFIGVCFYFFSNNFFYEMFEIIFEILKKLNISLLSGIQNKLNAYMLQIEHMSPGIIKIGLIEKIITFFVFYFNRKKINETKIERIFFNLYLACIFSYLYTNSISVLHDRLEILFIPSYWILYPIFLKKCKKNKLIIFVILITIFLGKYFNFYNKTLSSELYKYNNLEKNEYNYIKFSKIFFKTYK